jgi:hypothetical protein
MTQITKSKSLREQLADPSSYVRPAVSWDPDKQEWVELSVHPYYKNFTKDERNELEDFIVTYSTNAYSQKED